MKKHIQFSVLVCLILGFFYCYPASAQTLTLSSQTLEVEQNTDFSLTLTIDATANLFGIGFYLNFDPALLNFESADEGDLLSQGCSTSTTFLTRDKPAGKLNVVLTRMGSNCGTVSVPGTIATFNFKSLNQAGTTTLSFSDTALSIIENDELIQPFPAGTWNTVTVTVLPACGDGKCNGSETCSTCPTDCGACPPICGDGECNGSETCSTCPTDCGVCGGGGGGGGGTPPPDITPPAQPSNNKAEPADKQITLTWVNPANFDFKGVLVIRKENSAPSDKDDGTVVYQGAAEEYTDIDLDNDIIYYYAIFAYDTADNYSGILTMSAQPKAGVAPIEVPSETIISKSCPVNITNLYGAAKEIVECVSQREAQTTHSHNQHVPMDDITLPIYEKITQQHQADLTMQVKYSIAMFIHYGTPATKILGAGERAGVINSYRSVFNKFPHTESGWQDVIKIANGRWPTERNENKEQDAYEFFRKIYLREPDRNNSNDDAAITVITYGLRPANRNMESEKAGIRIFRSIYKHNPESAVDWDVVRAIAYSGATR